MQPGDPLNPSFLERMIDLRLLLCIRRADEFGLVHLVLLAFARQEGIHANDRQRTVVFLCLVVEALFLDLAALVHRVHRAEDAAPL